MLHDVRSRVMTTAAVQTAIDYAGLLAGQLSDDIGIDGDEIGVRDLLDALATQGLRLVTDYDGVSSQAYASVIASQIQS